MNVNKKNRIKKILLHFPKKYYLCPMNSLDLYLAQLCGCKRDVARVAGKVGGLTDCVFTGLCGALSEAKGKGGRVQGAYNQKYRNKKSMKAINPFQEALKQKTDKELEAISEDDNNYLPEERLLAWQELKSRNLVSDEMIDPIKPASDINNFKFTGLTDLYYTVWVDCLLRMKSQEQNKYSWKKWGMSAMSTAMTLNFLLFMTIFEKHILGILFYDTNIPFLSRYYNNIFDILVLFVLPVVVVNYLLIFRKNRCEKLIEKYPYYNGKFAIPYIMISIILPVVLAFLVLLIQ